MRVLISKRAAYLAREKKNVVRQSFLFSALLILLVAAAVAILSPGKDRPIRYDAKVEYAELRHQNLISQGAVFKGSIILLGDSHVEFSPANFIQSDSLNLGIQGDSTYAVLERLKDYGFVSSADHIFIAVGVNDLVMEYSAKETLASLEQLLQKLPAHATIYLSEILPLSESYGWGYINRQSLMINQQLSEWARHQSNVYLVEEPFSEETGIYDLTADFHRGDGIHLNDRGYHMWERRIQTVMNEAQQ